MQKRLNPNLAKIHRNYSVEEIALLFGAHKNTVRGWLKNGLPVCNTQRPVLILGADLRHFLQEKQTRRKRKCRPYELYCMRCRSPRRPAEDMVDYEPMSGATGRLMAICPTCSGMMNKYTNKAKLERIQDELDVFIPATGEHISKSKRPLVYSDLR